MAQAADVGIVEVVACVANTGVSTLSSPIGRSPSTCSKFRTSPVSAHAVAYVCCLMLSGETLLYSTYFEVILIFNNQIRFAKRIVYLTKFSCAMSVWNNGRDST